MITATHPRFFPLALVICTRLCDFSHGGGERARRKKFYDQMRESYDAKWSVAKAVESSCCEVREGNPKAWLLIYLLTNQVNDFLFLAEVKEEEKEKRPGKGRYVLRSFRVRENPEHRAEKSRKRILRRITAN